MSLWKTPDGRRPRKVTVDKFINGRSTVIDYHPTIETAKFLH